MADLFIGKNLVESVFELLGQKEDDITYSVGYALSESPSFLLSFLKYIGFTDNNSSDLKIHLQKHGENRGFTDVEIIEEGKIHIIIEAKKGWEFPSSEQLNKYTSRTSFYSKKAQFKKVIVLNESNKEYVDSHFKTLESNGVPVEVISWQVMRSLAMDSLSVGGNIEKRLLNHLVNYLRKISTMQNRESNMVYVVSLGTNKPEGWDIGWIDIVEKKNQYFCPTGGTKGGWPNEPPNYIAFRYYGKLQSIHHIESYKVFDNPNEHFQEIPAEDWGPHYLYELGPKISPPKEIRTGKGIFRNGRVWVMFDLLLTSNTISEAKDLTKERQLN